MQHRVDEICSLTSPDTWRHCPGDLNPADIPSPGLSAKELSSNTTWWNSTSFLYLPETAWPEIRPTQHEIEVVPQEAVKKKPFVSHSLVNTSTAPPGKRIDQVIEASQFGDLTKLLCVTALMLKFVHNVKNRARIAKGQREDLKALDLIEAEELWIKALQASSFAKEFLKTHHLPMSF